MCISWTQSLLCSCPKLQPLSHCLQTIPIIHTDIKAHPVLARDFLFPKQPFPTVVSLSGTQMSLCLLHHITYSTFCPAGFYQASPTFTNVLPVLLQTHRQLSLSVQKMLQSSFIMVDITLNTASEAILGQPRERPGQNAPSSDPLICIPACLWVLCLSWIVEVGPWQLGGSCNEAGICLGFHHLQFFSVLLYKCADVLSSIYIL